MTLQLRVLAAAAMLTMFACNAHDDQSKGTVIVDAASCRDKCQSTRMQCVDDCTDDICRSGCSTTATDCNTACEADGSDAGSTSDTHLSTSTQSGSGDESNKLPRFDGGMPEDSAGAAGSDVVGGAGGLDAAGSGGTGGVAAGSGGDGSAGREPEPSSGGVGGVILPRGGAGGFGPGSAGMDRPVVPMAGFHGPGAGLGI